MIFLSFLPFRVPGESSFERSKYDAIPCTILNSPCTFGFQKIH